MKYLKLLLALFCLGILFPVILTAQKSMTVDDLNGWNRISQQAISDDGKWIGCKTEPWTGEATIRLYQANGEEAANYSPAGNFTFSSSSLYFLTTKVPAKALRDSLKLTKTADDKMPMNELIIRHTSGKEETIDSIRSYKLAERADWMAYHTKRKDSTLYVRSLDGNKTFQFPAVKEFGFARKSEILYYISGGDTLGTKAGLYVLNPKKGTPTLIKEGDGIFKQTALNGQGDKIAFLYCTEKDSVYKGLDLWLSENNTSPQLVADRSHPAFPAGWVLSEHGRVRFSENSERLFFGTSPEPQQKDTTVLASERPKVQVWSWDEPVQYTVQSFNKGNDLKKSYQAVYNLSSNQLFQLADEAIPSLQLADDGNAGTALLSTSLPYSVSSMWEGRTRSDYYAVSLETGKRKLIKEGDYARLRLSPKGTYAWWYAETDSSWYTYSLADDKEFRLTTPVTFQAWNEDNDVPDYPSSYGSAGWTADDTYLVLYDRYDIWQFDPKASSRPANLTVNGRTNNLSYRWVQLDKDDKFIDTRKPHILRAQNEVTKGYGFYNANLSSPATPKTLIAGDFMLRTLIKAKDTNAVIYTTETFEQYPELRTSDLSFKKSVQLTDEGKQQEGFNWGTAELVSWISSDGKPLEGVVYKPANFNPGKKYPMIVNFYERNAETLYNYRMPEPHRSTIDYHLYTSNEYIIFNPDVRYTDGYPGESCYNSVMPGIALLIARGYINEKAIGAQGHSWGGYQVAYLATRTNLFAAIESGAPVVNMLSAYGGIRWGSGLNRSFQYEHGQSRIGGTPWSNPLRYMENSPLLTMDKVQTPILIMHNDADGHVPWYQGIEYFVALKRLQKPVWMLNYTGEPHWPMTMPNRIDFQQRMFQFFNHYLRNEPMPKWMSEGVRAVEQEFELGY